MILAGENVIVFPKKKKKRKEKKKKEPNNLLQNCRFKRKSWKSVSGDYQ